MFIRQDVSIAGSTINCWFNASCTLLEYLYKVLKNKITATDYLMAAETPIPVLTKDNPGAVYKGYHWLYDDPVHKLVLFDYQKTRGCEGMEEFLKHFSGDLQTDGYNADPNLKNSSIGNCQNINYLLIHKI